MLVMLVKHKEIRDRRIPSKAAKIFWISTLITLKDKMQIREELTHSRAATTI